jgi:hypothetical protein
VHHLHQWRSRLLLDDPGLLRLHGFHVRRRLRLLHVHEQHARLLQLLISSEQVQSRNRALCLFTPLLAILASERRSAAPYSRDLRASARGSDRPISDVGDGLLVSRIIGVSSFFAEKRTDTNNPQF